MTENECKVAAATKLLWPPLSRPLSIQRALENIERKLFATRCHVVANNVYMMLSPPICHNNRVYAQK